MQYGPTSFWSYAPDSIQFDTAEKPNIDLGPGDWVDWARNLPPQLRVSKKVHDAALRMFGSYFAPWCMAVNMRSFLRDLELCNLVTRLPPARPLPTRTSFYSPLLHNCVFYIGLHLNHRAWPELAAEMDHCFASHCASMIIEETDDPRLSTPRALALFASCVSAANEAWLTE